MTFPVTRALAAVPLLWAGLLLGVSFVATPAKFLAPSLPMAQALDVGRWTFHVLAWIEGGLLAVTTALIVIAWRAGCQGSGIVAGLIAAVAALMAVKTLALLPLLDDRVLRIMAGESVPPSRLHIIYIALDALRLGLILAAGVVAIRRIEGRRT